MEKHHSSSHYFSWAAKIKAVNREMRAFRQSARCKDCEAFIVLMDLLWRELETNFKWHMLSCLYFTVDCWSVTVWGRSCTHVQLVGNCSRVGSAGGQSGTPGAAFHKCAIRCSEPRPLSLNWFVSQPIEIIRWCACVCVQPAVCILAGLLNKVWKYFNLHFLRSLQH